MSQPVGCHGPRALSAPHASVFGWVGWLAGKLGSWATALIGIARRITDILGPLINRPALGCSKHCRSRGTLTPALQWLDCTQNIRTRSLHVRELDVRTAAHHTGLDWRPENHDLPPIPLPLAPCPGLGDDTKDAASHATAQSHNLLDIRKALIL